MKKQGKRRMVVDVMGGILKRTGLSTKQLSQLGLQYHVALAAYQYGKGNEYHFGALVTSSKLSAALCKRNTLLPGVDVVYAAQSALLAMYDSGRTGFTGDELKTMARFTLVHDEHLKIVPVGLIESCLKEIYEELQ